MAEKVWAVKLYTKFTKDITKWEELDSEEEEPKDRALEHTWSGFYREEYHYNVMETLLEFSCQTDLFLLFIVKESVSFE